MYLFQYDMMISGTNGQRVVKEKAKEEDLLLVAATDFGCPGYVRISYCVDEDMIKRSFKAFKALKEKYAK